MIRTAATLVLAAVLSACSSGVTSETSAAVPAAPGSPAIAKIVTRDRSITLLAAKGEVRATVFDGSGRMIGREVPIDQLQNVDATAYEATHWSVAGRAAAEPTHPVPWKR
jgi:hypothetical protein